MNIGIIGYGIVGGTTGKVFSKAHEIYPYDKYKSPYNSQESLINLVKNSEIIFICVPTPMKKSGEMDYSSIHQSLSQVLDVAKDQNLNPNNIIVVIRSTAVSGTTDELAAKYPFRFVFNPEFLTEKNALQDMENTDRVVIGVNEIETKKIMERLYKSLFPKAKYIFTTRKEAEMIKYAANVFLASQIGIANEIYHICQALNINLSAN